jgi:hypothetical protein
MTKEFFASAEKLKQLLIDISPMIEEYTARVCPVCRDVCCKQRHGIMNEHDLRYLTLLKAPLPSYDPARPLDGPCQSMDSFGCLLPRWLRPWRCTWYFCDPLIEAMQSGPQKKARTLSALIQEILDLRSTW